MIWNGKELKTYGDIFNAVSSCKTKEDAEKFLEEYEKETPHARANVGYIVGYGSEDERKRLYELFGEIHPIYGKC